MDETRPNDMKDNNLPKQSIDNTTCEMSSHADDHGERGDCTGSDIPADILNDVCVLDVESACRSDSGQNKCETTSEVCQSSQKIQYTDNQDQSVPDILHGFSSGNIQQDVQTTIEDIPVTLDCQAAPVISKDSDLLNGSVQCNNTTHKKVETNGCDDTSLNQDSTDFCEVVCATLKDDSEGVSQDGISCHSVESTELQCLFDGRERFSKKSDQVEVNELSTEDLGMCNSTAPLVCNSDQNCTSSLDFKDNESDVECSIPNKVTEEESDVEVKKCDDFHKTSRPNHLCIVANGISCYATNSACNNLQLKSLASSLVDEILELATTHFLELGNETETVADPETCSISDNGGVCDDQGETSSNPLSESLQESEKVTAVSELLTSNCSFDLALENSVTEISNSANLVEASPPVHDQSHVEISTGSLKPVIQNGCTVPSIQSNVSVGSTLLDSDNVSSVAECDSDVNVDCIEESIVLNSEAKINSSNEHLDQSQEAGLAEVGSKSESETLDMGVTSENVNALNNIFITNISVDDVDPSQRDVDLSTEAKVESCKDVIVEEEDESSIISNTSSKCMEEISSLNLTNSPSPVETLNELPDISLNNQELSVEILNLNDSGPLLVNESEGDINLNSANEELDPKVTNTSDIAAPNSVDENIDYKIELSVAKLQVLCEETADLTPTSFQDSSEETPEIHFAKEDPVKEEVNSISAGSDSIPVHESIEVDEDPKTSMEEKSLEVTCTSELSAARSLHDNAEENEKPVGATEEQLSKEVNLNSEIIVSPADFEGKSDIDLEEKNCTAVQHEVVDSKPDLDLSEEDLNTEAKTVVSTLTENCNKDLPPMPCQFIVPVVNVYPPILEETYEGMTDDESEISHATSDSESDSVKNVRPVCDGMNTINYKPLLEEDTNDRSTLSLISELDEASVKEDNLEFDQTEDESANLIMEDSIGRNDNIEIDNNSNTELVQRVKGQRIMQVKTNTEMEELLCEEEKQEEKETSGEEYADKIRDIRDALKSGSLERLRDLARSKGGLVNDQIRKECWPRLLGIDSSSTRCPLPKITQEDLRTHHEYNQVVLDVNRSLRRFPSKISPEERVELQNQLTEIILRVLMKRRDLSYYQGYHDVAVTTLLVAGKDAAFHILERISVVHLADCMLPTMERTMYLLNYIYPLLQRINPNLVERMDRLEVGTIFCLPWFLTWYGYSLNRYEDVVRVFDYFLASPPLAPLYLAAVVVGRRSAEVLAADCDHATVHSLLSRIPDSLPLEASLREATDLYRNHPPDDIENEVRERCERLRKAQEEEEEQRRQMRQRRLVRRHSMPAIAARQMPGWYFIDRIFGMPMIQGRRIVQVSATVMFGMLAWHLRNEMYRYF